jgi:predicted RND superfamily exporter protein
MLAVIISLPITLVIYKLIFGIEYFAALQVVAIFIILGISADNFFVFNDAWEQSNKFKWNMHRRMAHTWNRSVQAMMTTTFTTGIAFLATGTSSIMPIAAFGFFSSTLIFVNFLLDITWIPAVIVLHNKYIRYRMCVCNKKDKEY